LIEAEFSSISGLTPSLTCIVKQAQDAGDKVLRSVSLGKEYPWIAPMPAFDGNKKTGAKKTALTPSPPQ
jgi:hypothetical protein